MSDKVLVDRIVLRDAITAISFATSEMQRQIDVGIDYGCFSEYEQERLDSWKWTHDELLRNLDG